jgi:hypothetical protein
MPLLAILILTSLVTGASRAEAQSPVPQISKEEVEAVRMYLQTPGYVEEFKTRAKGKIGFEEGLDVGPWPDRINRAILSGAAGAKACGTTFAMPGETPDVLFRIVGRDAWTAEDIQAQLDLPANTNVSNIVSAMLDRVTTNGLVSLSDDTGQRPVKDYFFYVPAPTDMDSHRIFALYRAAFGLPVGPDAFGSGLFSYFIGGGSIGALAGPPGEEEERICRAMNLQNIFCNPIEGEVTSERIRVALQAALEHCHNLH